MPAFETPTPITLSIELDAGEVILDAATTATTEIELRPLRPGDADAIALIERAHVKHSDGAATVHLPDGRSLGLLRRTPEIALAVRLPVGSTLAAKLRSAELRVTGELENVRLETASGDTSLADIAGSAVVISASGDVRIATIGGALRLKSASGDVTVDTCCADASIQTASGDITVGVVEGDLDVKSASGDIAVRAADASVRARTASGDVDLGRVRAGKTEVDTVSGDVHVGVERGVSVRLDVSSLSGGVGSALERTDSADDGAKILKLHVKTVSGDIQLRPA